MNYTLYNNDIPEDLFNNCKSIAIDTETMGLNPHLNRLCLVQISSGDNHAHLIKTDDYKKAINLKKLLSNKNVEKLFHFARFDVAVIKKYLDVSLENIFCTKIASKLVRTYTDKHGLKELCRTVGIEISKEEQTSDWGAFELSESQLKYAAGDVLYLHKIKENLVMMLKRENKFELALECFDFLKTRADLDLNYGESDIFSHR